VCVSRYREPDPGRATAGTGVPGSADRLDAGAEAAEALGSSSRPAPSPYEGLARNSAARTASETGLGGVGCAR